MAMMGKIRRKRFGEILVAEKLITQEQVKEALEIQRTSGDSLGNILLDMGYIHEPDIVKALSIQYHIPYINTANYDIDQKLVESFDARLLHKYTVLPFDKIGRLLLLIATDIPSKAVMEEVQKACGCDIALYLGTATDVSNRLTQMVPISTEEMDQLRQQLKARKATQAAANVASKHRRGESGEQDDPANLGLSSEQLLSSLDEAWDSIFVESEDD